MKMTTARWCLFVGENGASWTDGEGNAHEGYPPRELEHHFGHRAISAEEIREISEGLYHVPPSHDPGSEQ